MVALSPCPISVCVLRFRERLDYIERRLRNRYKSSRGAGNYVGHYHYIYIILYIL